jgi:hypothetical protein
MVTTRQRVQLLEGSPYLHGQGWKKPLSCCWLSHCPLDSTGLRTWVTFKSQFQLRIFFGFWQYRGLNFELAGHATA